MSAEPLQVSPAELYALAGTLRAAGEGADDLRGRLTGEHVVGAPLQEAVDGLLECHRVAADALAGELRSASVHAGAAITRVTKDDRGFALLDSRGERHEVDRLVLALPPPEAIRILPPELTRAGGPLHALRAFTYLPLHYALHLDPAYVPADRAAWSADNLSVHDGWAETSTWCGPTHGVDVFKSQVTHRAHLPARVLALERFRQLFPTPAAYRAQRALAARQGHDGLFFAGHYTSVFGIQENAIRSAVEVAATLAPDSARLRTLTARNGGKP